MANTGKRRTHYERIIAAWAVIALTGGMPHVMKADGAALRAATAEMQADGVVHGVIVDDKGEAIIGASVLEKGTSNGTITDADGKFTLRAKAGTRLVISYIGYRTQEVTASATMRIVLHEDSELLNEVVVVGYGTQKKVNLTGAVATVDIGKTLEARPYSDVSKALQGAVSGLSVVNSSGQRGAAPTMTIRGVGTLSNSAQSAPFILVDGVPMDDLSLLNTQDIQSVSVLKDAASTSIYGARAAFGVILITTKSASKTDRTTVNYTNNIAWETPTILPNYPDVPTQLRALIEANDRAGDESELFGMYLKQMLPDAEKWRDRNNGRKTGYREMVLGEDFTLDKNGVGSYFADWDMVNIMFRKWRPSQSHNVSVQGTSGKTSYYMSVGYNHDEGVMKFNPEKLNKWTTMLNVTTDLTNWLQVGARFSYSNKGMTGPATRRTTYQYMWRWGSFFGPYGTYKGTDFRNDIAYRKQAGDRIENDAFTRLGGFLKATLAKGLTLNADYTFNVLNRNRRIAEVPLKGWNSWCITPPHRTSKSDRSSTAPTSSTSTATTCSTCRTHTTSTSCSAPTRRVANSICTALHATTCWLRVCRSSTSLTATSSSTVRTRTGLRRATSDVSTTTIKASGSWSLMAVTTVRHAFRRTVAGPSSRPYRAAGASASRASSSRSVARSTT